MAEMAAAAPAQNFGSIHQELWSACVTTACGSGRKKLGQPVPLSNLAVELNSGSKHPAQTKVPRRCSLLSGLVNARSVPASRRTWYRSAPSKCLHSAGEWVTSNLALASPDAGRNRSHARPPAPIVPSKARRSNLSNHEIALGSVQLNGRLLRTGNHPSDAFSKADANRTLVLAPRALRQISSPSSRKLRTSPFGN